VQRGGREQRLSAAIGPTAHGNLAQRLEQAAGFYPTLRFFNPLIV
jgi:hypothetical protein